MFSVLIKELLINCMHNKMKYYVINPLIFNSLLIFIVDL